MDAKNRDLNKGVGTVEDYKALSEADKDTWKVTIAKSFTNRGINKLEAITGEEQLEYILATQLDPFEGVPGTHPLDRKEEKTQAKVEHLTLTDFLLRGLKLKLSPQQLRALREFDEGRVVSAYNVDYSLVGRWKAAPSLVENQLKQITTGDIAQDLLGFMKHEGPKLVRKVAIQNFADEANIYLQKRGWDQHEIEPVVTKAAEMFELSQMDYAAGHTTVQPTVEPVLVSAETVSKLPKPFEIVSFPVDDNPNRMFAGLVCAHNVAVGTYCKECKQHIDTIVDNMIEVPGSDFSTPEDRGAISNEIEGAISDRIEVCACGGDEANGIEHDIDCVVAANQAKKSPHDGCICNSTDGVHHSVECYLGLPARVRNSGQVKVGVTPTFPIELVVDHKTTPEYNKEHRLDASDDNLKSGEVDNLEKQGDMG